MIKIAIYIVIALFICGCAKDPPDKTPSKISFIMDGEEISLPISIYHNKSVNKIGIVHKKEYDAQSERFMYLYFSDTISTQSLYRIGDNFYNFSQIVYDVICTANSVSEGDSSWVQLSRFDEDGFVEGRFNALLIRTEKENLCVPDDLLRDTMYLENGYFKGYVED